MPIEMIAGTLKCNHCQSETNAFNILILAPGQYVGRCMICGSTNTLPDENGHSNYLGKFTYLEKLKQSVVSRRRKKP